VRIPGKDTWKPTFRNASASPAVPAKQCATPRRHVQAIGICVAAVDDKRQPRLNSNFYMPLENGLLCLSCRILVIVIQSGLTQPHHRCVLGEFSKSDEIGLRDRICIMRMDACRGGYETGMIRGKEYRGAARINAASHGYDMSHPRRTGAVQHRVKVRYEPLVIQVGVRVYKRV